MQAGWVLCGACMAVLLQGGDAKIMPDAAPDAAHDAAPDAAGHGLWAAANFSVHVDTTPSSHKHPLPSMNSSTQCPGKPAFTFGPFPRGVCCSLDVIMNATAQYYPLAGVSSPNGTNVTNASMLFDGRRLKVNKCWHFPSLAPHFC